MLVQKTQKARDSAKQHVDQICIMAQSSDFTIPTQDLANTIRHSVRGDINTTYLYECFVQSLKRSHKAVIAKQSRSDKSNQLNSRATPKKLQAITSWTDILAAHTLNSGGHGASMISPRTLLCWTIVSILVLRSVKHVWHCAYAAKGNDQ